MPVVTIRTAAPGILRIAVNRPEKRNAINADARHELAAAFAQACDDAAVRAIVLTGEGGHFSAGGDLDSMAGLNAEQGHERIASGHRMVRAIVNAPKPVISAIEGYAVGAGASLALLADTVVLAEGGTIGFPFFRVGLVPDMGLMHTLPRRVGAAKARQLLLYARMLKGKDAVAAGVADELAPDGGAEAQAIKLADELGSMPPFAFARAKAHLAHAPVSLEAALEMEAMAQALCFVTPDHAEGRTAFLEKRAPRFGQASAGKAS